MLNDIFQHLPALPLRSPGLLWCLYWAPCDRNIHLIIVSLSHHHHLWVLIFLSSSKVTATVIMFHSAFPTSKRWNMVTSKQTLTLSSIIKNTRFLHRPDQPNTNYIHTDESRYGAFTKRLQCTSPENHRLADGREKGGFFYFFFLRPHLISDGAISFNIHKHPRFHSAVLLFFNCLRSLHMHLCVIGSSGLQAVICVFAFPLIW